jgi:hypothetical protein
MQSRLWISGALLVLSLSVQTASAGPQEDVAAAGQKWATVFAENNPDAMLPLYGKDAVLWGTLSPTIRSDPAAVKAYLRLPGVAEGDRQARRPVDPRLREHRGEQRLLHVLLYQGRGNQIDSGPLQLHLCEGRQRLEDRRPPLVGGASPAQVSRIQSRAIAVIMACARSGCSCWAPDKAANASR